MHNSSSDCIGNIFVYTIVQNQTILCLIYVVKKITNKIKNSCCQTVFVMWYLFICWPKVVLDIRHGSIFYQNKQCILLLFTNAFHYSSNHRCYRATRPPFPSISSLHHHPSPALKTKMQYLSQHNQTALTQTYTDTLQSGGKLPYCPRLTRPLMEGLL